MRNVLIIEDDKTLSAALRDGFERAGFSVLVARDGAAALDLSMENPLDVIIVDVMLPKISGFEFCEQIRKTGNNVPIIFLSVRSQESDKVLGLKLGGDDYVTKPFSFIELMARVEALLRRRVEQTERAESIRFGNLEVNFKDERVLKQGIPIELSDREFRILKYLIEQRGHVINRNQLLDAIWGYDSYPITRTVDVHVAKLRSKIEDNPNKPRHLITIHRKGYKFIP